MSYNINSIASILVGVGGGLSYGNGSLKIQSVRSNKSCQDVSKGIIACTALLF